MGCSELIVVAVAKGSYKLDIRFDSSLLLTALNVVKAGHRWCEDARNQKMINYWGRCREKAVSRSWQFNCGDECQAIRQVISAGLHGRSSK